MNKATDDINNKYLSEMLNASDDTTLGKVRDLWWPSLLDFIKSNGIEYALNNLDLAMEKGNVEFRLRADKYAASQGHQKDTAKYIQLVSQFLKSNTGKMFERFVGLSLSHCLLISKSDYCVVPFKIEYLKYYHDLTFNDFLIKVKLGKKNLTTHIDSDLIAFNLKNESAPIYMISVKSTLKDRFHNVPFWNVLKSASIVKGYKDITAVNPKVLTKAFYVSACSDLAVEQPDFRTQTGPRNLLCIDAALLDGAFVTASKARGLGSDKGPVIGNDRISAFYPLSRFFLLLK
ncbi:MAG: hypothetical protein A2905_00410 [Candidatus Levybacteria bacterium RIFCSPLOWO2_01_FULL_36_10]|nr:MAG: hypothetical protein A2905_00410 [Candidatus Levybacteria bacterium RIFCSPLOWO2_01_FULL_36_10]